MSFWVRGNSSAPGASCSLRRNVATMVAVPSRLNRTVKLAPMAWYAATIAGTHMLGTRSTVSVRAESF